MILSILLFMRYDRLTKISLEIVALGCGLALERGTNEALLRLSAREFAFSQIPLAVILCKKLGFSNLSWQTDGRLGVRFSPDMKSVKKLHANFSFAREIL